MSKTRRKTQHYLDVMIAVHDWYDEGKRGFVYRTRLNDVTTKIPSFGVEVDTATQNDMDIWSFMATGRNSVRPLIKSMVLLADVVILLVDSTNINLLNEADRQEFSVNIYHNNPIFAIAVNNHDMDGAMNVAQIQDMLKVQEVRKTHTIEVFPVSTRTNEGISEMMDWIWRTQKNRKVEAQKDKGVSFLKTPVKFFKNFLKL